MPCDARLNGGRLVCTEGDHPDNPKGHVFMSTSASDRGEGGNRRPEGQDQ